MTSVRFAMRAACVGVACAVSAARAQTPAYRLDTLTADDGLPSGFVTQMAQTRDGFLWLLSGGNLVRYDGYDFRVFNGVTDSALTARVNNVYAAGDTVWLALDNGRILSLADGRFTALGTTPGGYGMAPIPDARGRLLIIGTLVWRWNGSRFDSVPVPAGYRSVGQLPWRDGAGHVWVLGAGGALMQITERGAEMAGTTTSAYLVRYAARGQVLLARQRSGLLSIEDRTGVVLASCRCGPNSTPMLVDRGGRLWVHEPREIRVYAPGLVDPLERIPLPAGFAVNTVIEDLAGNIWMAGSGVIRIQAVPFRTLGREAGLPGGQVRSVSRGPRGSVLVDEPVAPWRVYQIDGVRARHWGDSGRVTMDARGTVWLSKWSANILGRREGLPPLVFPRPGAFALLLADDPLHTGVSWFAGEHALYHVDPYADGGPRIMDSISVAGFVRRAAIAADSVVWVVTDDPDGRQRLRRFDRGAERVYAQDDGLPPVTVRAIVPDTGGVVWLGTYGAGLVRLSGDRFQAVRERDGLAENIASDILDDGAGNFWMAGNRSIHRVARAEVEAFLDGRAPRVHGIAYGRRDGLTDPETSGDHGTRSADGRLWFPTFGGAAVVDPVYALALDSTPPLAHVLGMRTTADTLLSRGVTDLPRGQRRISLVYTASSLRNPAGVRFAYKLDGVDDDWIYAGTGRVAEYNRVGPGRHTFRVRAMNAGGVWSTADATLTFSVPHYFTETIPFWLIVATLLALALRYGFTWRVRQLRQRQAELAALVDARTAELGNALVTVEAQADQLRSLDEAKSRFFANVSHEFRTPLSLILGPVEDLRDGRAGALPEPARKRLEGVMANGRRLVQLVEQLLDVARLESGTLHLKADVRDLVPLLRRISESFASLAERRDLGFRVSVPVGGLRVRYDPDQMEKVLTNLLGNALKFTPAGGRVELRATADGDGTDGWAVVEVEDNGPGIPKGHLPRVFDRFYQVDDSPRRAHEGAGIGLALAKELVDLHHGTLGVRSTVGVGSTFTLRLPLATGDARTTGETAVSPLLEARAASAIGSKLAGHIAPAGAGTPPDDVTTVLVAEDNAELLAYLRDHLADHYRVLEAGNGAVALRLAREHVPDLIVSDVMMPEMDGQALCAAVKRDPEIDFIPVILLTAKASRESRLAGLEGGADDYLAKPVDMRELLVRANNLITSRRRLKERFQEAQRDLPKLKAPFPAAPRGAAAETFVHKLYAVMADHIGDENFEAEALASALAMSRSTLYRKVEGVLGRSPMDVLRDYRLDQAAQWLVETDANVSEVAYGVGFKSVPHFCARFRERFHCTPSAYRAERANAQRRT